MHRYRQNRGRFVAFGILTIVLVFLVNTGFQAYAQSQEKKKHEIIEEETFERPEPTRPIQPEVPGVNRYQEDKVFLEYADSLYKRKTNRFDTIERQILKGNVKFRQAGMWMYCDSAYYYPEENSLDAFSNVRMEQGDTLFVYADKLFYNGDEHLAKLKNGPTREKVTLINKDVTLTTDSLDYNMEIDLGWYVKWGTIDDKVNTLTSLYGEYSPRTKRAEFFTDVVLENKKDGFTMYTDTLYYSTETHIANIESRTEIQSANDTIITNLATYYTDTGNADLLSRSLIIHKDSTGNVTTLEGDSIVYDNATRISRAYMYKDPFKRSTPMVITDTAQKTTLIGGFGIYNDSTKEAMATIYPLLMEYSQGDTLFLRADTILTVMVTEMIPDPKRRTKSGFPEWNEEIITMMDSLTGKLWIDTAFFKVKVPYVETPVNMLHKVAPPPKEPEQIQEAEELSQAVIKNIDKITPKNIDGIEVVSADSIENEIKRIELKEDQIVEKNLQNIENFAPGDSLNINNEISVPKDSLYKNLFSDSISIKNLMDSLDLKLPEDSIERIHMLDSLKRTLNLDSIGNFYLPDSLKIQEEEIGEIPPAVDSIPYQFHVVLAYHRGRFFKKDMQGIADSIVFVERDSMLYLFRKPIVWSEERQVTGNRIDVHFNDSTTDWAYLPDFGLMSEYVDEDFYNQIFGKEITAYFENQGLRRMNVSGNVETIFLPQESDSTFNRLVNAESSYMEVYLDSNKLDWLKMWPEVSGTVTPIFLVKRPQMYLQKFKWWGFLRPQREWYGDQLRWADDLGEVPDELEQYFLAPSDFGEPKSLSGPVVNLPKSSLQLWDNIPEVSLTDTLPPVLQSDSLESLFNDNFDLPLDTLGMPSDSISDIHKEGIGHFTQENEVGEEGEESLSPEPDSWKNETIEDIEEISERVLEDAKETEDQTELIEEAVEQEEGTDDKEISPQLTDPEKEENHE